MPVVDHGDLVVFDFATHRHARRQGVAPGADSESCPRVHAIIASDRVAGGDHGQNVEPVNHVRVREQLFVRVKRSASVEVDPGVQQSRARDGYRQVRSGGVGRKVARLRELVRSWREAGEAVRPARLDGGAEVLDMLEAIGYVEGD